MRFTVPQFIEHEAKIVGPLTFRQFIFVAIAGTICFFAYFTAPFFYFLISCFVFGGGAVAFAFLKISGRSLFTILGNFLKFNLAPKIYIWRKVETQIQVLKKEVVKEKKAIDELPLKIAEKSQLKKLRTRVETKIK